MKLPPSTEYHFAPLFRKKKLVKKRKFLVDRTFVEKRTICDPSLFAKARRCIVACRLIRVRHLRMPGGVAQSQVSIDVKSDRGHEAVDCASKQKKKSNLKVSSSGDGDSSEPSLSRDSSYG